MEGVDEEATPLVVGTQAPRKSPSTWKHIVLVAATLAGLVMLANFRL